MSKNKSGWYSDRRTYHSFAQRKPEGWRGESARHGLSARGIKTASTKRMAPYHAEAARIDPRVLKLSEDVEKIKNPDNDEYRYESIDEMEHRKYPGTYREEGGVWDDLSIEEREAVIRMGNSWIPDDLRFARMSWEDLDDYWMAKGMIAGIIREKWDLDYS
jgi:hypothetical protein